MIHYISLTLEGVADHFNFGWPAFFAIFPSDSAKKIAPASGLLLFLSCPEV